MKRTDMPAIRDTILWIGLAIGFATAGVLLWGTWWAVPCFIAYGVLYGSASDSRWHETGHGTAFKTRWMNEAVYQLASFCMMRNPTPWRYQHTLHHTDTLIVGIDPEVLAMRPARLASIVANFFGLLDVPGGLYQMLVHASGRLTEAEKDWVPEEERPKAYRTARIWVAIYATTIGVAVVTQSWIPIVLIGGPRAYGAFMHILYALTQHAGMGENVLDHRLNTRTVLMGASQPFPLLEHELPPRTSHVRCGAVPQASRLARGHQERRSGPVPVDVGSAEGHHPHAVCARGRTRRTASKASFLQLLLLTTGRLTASCPRRPVPDSGGRHE